jgi:hypothetical protein
VHINYAGKLLFKTILKLYNAKKCSSKQNNLGKIIFPYLPQVQIKPGQIQQS